MFLLLRNKLCGIYVNNQKKTSISKCCNELVSVQTLIHFSKLVYLNTVC